MALFFAEAVAQLIAVEQGRSIERVEETAWYLIGAIVVVSWLGVSMAYILVTWRVAVAHALVMLLSVSAMILAGYSEAYNDAVLYLDPNYVDIDDGWATGLDLDLIILGTIETLFIALPGGLAIILGFRWHKRAVEDRIFE